MNEKYKHRADFHNLKLNELLNINEKVLDDSIRKSIFAFIKKDGERKQKELYERWKKVFGDKEDK